MPNWVYNQLTVSGYKDDVLEMKRQVSRPFVQKQADYTKTEVSFVNVEINIPFSFWNIIRPTDDIMDEYNGLQPKVKSDLSVTDPNWKEDMLAKSQISNHWYDWNIRNWGCKWDVSDIEVIYESDDSITYRFSTAWSPPIDAIYKLSEQYSELLFEIDFEEEQGWGGTQSIRDGQVLLETYYDIPDSHEDYEERGKDCICEWQDTENWFKDCPADPEEWEWIDDGMGRSWGNWKLKNK